MFEAHVLHLLRRYLGEYVHGLSAEALRISVWKGDVVLKDLKLKAEALNSLKLPVTVKAGFVGTITLKVPWKSLGKEPVIVLIDRVFVLAHPAPDGRSVKEEDRDKLFDAKLQQIEEAESATLEAISRSKLGSQPVGNSWLGSLIATIIGNLKISISNVHIRYEDSSSNPGYQFSCGVTLAKLAAVTTDEQGNETFDTSGALDRLRKSLQLERLAMYHDSNCQPWKLDKKWEDLCPQEWVEVFEDGINEPSASTETLPKWSQERQFVVSPINGVLKYHRLGNQERNDPEIPFEEASLVVTDVSLTITEAQYHDWIRLLEVISRYKTYVDISHLRPIVLLSEAPHLWWQYAAQATLQQKKVCYRFSWDQIQRLCQIRRRYIELYAGSLQQSSNTDYSEIRDIEKDLDAKVILLWRFLAHAKIESLKSKEEAEQRRLKKGSWFSLRWLTPSEDTSGGDDPKGSDTDSEKFTKEEWQAINNLLSCQPDADLTLNLGKDSQHMVHHLANISIGQAAARIININQTEIVCGRFEQLHVSTKFKHRSIHCDLRLRFYGLSAPEGSLAQSVSSEKKVNALAANFVHSPVGENVDWRLSATISPCHATVLIESYKRFLEFINRSSAVSPTVTFETATALQNKIEKVTRRAQEQFQMVLEEQSRFALDIDLDAPKVRIPIRASALSKCDGHFLLDFGHFTLNTKEGQFGDQGQSLYSRFYISGRDIAAFFTDCDCESQSQSSPSPLCPPLEDAGNRCSLIDPCGMAVIVDQIKVPHPRYPSSRVSVQMPSLGIHFSPARYCKLMELLDIIYCTTGSSGQPDLEIAQFENFPWNPPDLVTEARILVWKGIGYSVAAWHPCYLVLSGLYIYVLESEVSHSYQRRSSMIGKQVYEVPPINVGGSVSCLLVSARGIEIQKALESFNTLVIEFRDEEDKATWLRALMQATYRASAPFSVDILGNASDTASEFSETQATDLKPADLVINGALLETKLSLYGKTGDDLQGRAEETQILEVLAGGGKVHVVRLNGDLTAKMKLHSLKIKDELQGSLSSGAKYLAYSVQQNDHVSALRSPLGSPGQEHPLLVRDDDIFTDALPEFMSLSDSASNSTSPRLGDITGRAELDLFGTLVHEEVAGKGKIGHGDVFYEAEGSDNSDFVSVSFSTRNPSSPNYDGIDAQMNIRMSKLEFFCNRPTLVALIGFGFDLSSTSTGSSMTTLDDQSSAKSNKAEEIGQTFVKGLLGHGKGRVVFYLNMDVDSVSVFLNKEDDSQLAMFVQESFILDLKVHPSSLSIEGRLGNFRLCDMSLGMNHCWGWLCDIRDQGAESLINFTFSSYSVGDDDYEGYDYSLRGRLSAVRIVFLYRFVQEITAYFMELATPHTEEAIKLVDKVGGFESLIQKYEIDGSSALKLDLSLDTPIIIVPRNSMSKDYMQLDLGQLQVTNQIRWHGCPDKDPSAVHLDVLNAEILGINMAVGINGSIGKPMIREGQGIHVCVRRSLRDVFRKVPTFSLDVKVGLLHAVMSDKEYNVILDCVTMNLSEEPLLPPSFRDSNSGSKETMRLLADKVNMNSQVLLSRTVTIIAVELDHALLELCNGVHEDSPLAHIAIEGLWVSYRMTSLSEADLYVTVPRFYVLDIRPGTKPEMRLMVGSCADAPKQATAGNFPFSLNKSGFMRVDSQLSPGVDAPTSTMFLMDYRWRSSSQSFVLRAQQPRVLVVPDFLLAVGEYFVPALGALTGREELMDPKNDPITRDSSILLSASVYEQTEDTIVLSPNRQLVADAVDVEEYTYDGGGKTIRLTEEIDPKHGQSLRFRPIIFLGRGKKLRFANVKIENGSLLRRYTYLSNDSSYSVCPEDGVEVLLLENLFSDDDRKNLDWANETSCGSDNFAEETDSCKMDNFTLEAQVVSPELTFYDGSKSSLDSFHGEKLLRAKMDLSFMYAAKENDTWIRALVKDLTVEAGSGLIVLEPVDISAGYTSVKDKTNVSLVSTDVYAHLSMSVISLILNLQTQTSAALHFGNIDPLAPCTNFDRLSVSSGGKDCPSTLTFWRPRAPSNYVILGDCVTARPVPPTQAVMAVSITYGRVRKPLGFKLVGLLPISHEEVGVEGHSDEDGDCSLWLPIAPAGYLAMGCVVYKGSQPPPTHIVHCIRSDLVTSTSYSECIFSAASVSCSTNGYSIWRVDNVIRSFIAHPSAECCPNLSCYDLHNLLLWNSSWHRFSLKESTSKQKKRHSNGSQRQSNSQSAISTGWDVVRSIAKPANCYISTPNFERIWWDKGSDSRRAVSVWRPIPHPGYGILGDCIIEGLEPPALGIVFKADNAEISAKPVQFTKVAHIVSKGLDDAFFWYPIAPPGYASLGCVVTRFDVAPKPDSFCCPRMDLVNQANIVEVPISRSLSSKGSQCWSIWKVENQACTFLARSDLKRPSTRLALAIGDSLKPKARDNITAEMKLRCFSVTVLDSLGGMMTPLFDATFTNIKLATHGRPEAMNAILVSSMAASTFNTNLEAWEPLVEPFDGIFKFETYDTNSEPPFGLGKRARVAATSTLNLNLSAANLDMFAEAMVSWRKHQELENKAMKLTKEVDNRGSNDDNPGYAALDEDEFQIVIVENKLGCDIRVKKVEQNIDTIEKLHHDDCTSVWLPPPRYSDRLNVADESREARRYVAVQILEAKGLSVIDDGNSPSFFCALRLSVDSQETNQQKLFPQSARTKCVKPITFKGSQLDVGNTKWNELFIFEVPHKGLAKLEVEVTNLAAKAGKGEVVGATSFSVGRGASTLQKVASVRMLHQLPNGQRTVSHSLVRKAQPNSDDIISSGCLVVSSYYFERTTAGSSQSSALTENDSELDIGFWVGLGPQGEWQSFRSFLPQSVIAKTLNDDFIAMDVVMRNGKKHAIFRGLATVENDSDVKLDFCVSTLSRISRHDFTAINKSQFKEQDRASDVDVFSTINPGSASVLPWRSTSKHGDYCLLVRPCVDHSSPQYLWGYAVTKGSGYFDGKDHSSVDQGLFSRQITTKQGNKMHVSPLRLNQLEKMDLLMCCLASGNNQFWLSISTDAAVLQTELNSPVYDWTLSINSPLKLENRLPCAAEFTVWEKRKEGDIVQRHLGIISSRGSSHIYSADVCKPIYISLFLQGGWVMEKDPVLILDLTSSNHASSFWMVHQFKKRRLRVSIERDVGGTAAAPKTIRFFVPYWISNDSSLSLDYRVVEIDPGENPDSESLILPKTVKSAKTVLRSPSNAMDRKSASVRKNIQVLEAIEDTSPLPSMLSPQDYVGRGGVMLFSSRNDTYLSPRVGIAVAVRNSEIYSPGISLLELEKKQRVDIRAISSDGTYYKLSAILHMTSDRTKVVHFQPHTLFINRVGCPLYLQQCNTQMLELVRATDPPKHFGWKSSKVELLKVRLDGYQWSAPFSVEAEGLMNIFLKSETGSAHIYLRVEVRSGTKSSRCEVIFRPNSSSSPYRIENRSMFLPIRYRQVDGTIDSWRSLLPNSAASFWWEDLGRQKLLEMLVDGTDPSKSEKYILDEISNHQPIHVAGGPSKALRVTILREEKTYVMKISDWMPESQVTGNQRIPITSLPSSTHDSQNGSNILNSEFHIIIELAELGLSIIDHTPEEILYMSVQNLLLSYSTELDSGISRFKARMQGIQVDNQLPLTPMPVLFRPQRVGEETDYILKFSMTQQMNGSLDLCVYPYIGFQGPENSPFLINIHEPIIWRLHGMIQHMNLNRLFDSQSNAVSVDPIIQIRVLNISEVRFKVSMAMSPTQRPVGVLGFWSSLMTALGNTENMPVRINQRFLDNVCMRQSVLISNATLNIKKDLLSQPFQLLSGVDILGNASSALGHMSKGVAALSMDKKFIQGRRRQDSKGVEDFGDVLREGGGALAKGLFRGVTGILTKPLEGAKSSGVEGFVQGVGKGIIGAAAQPVSGVLDLLSKTTEGANAMRMKIASAITSEDQLLRRRLPRVINGDNLVRPYDEYRAQGQVIMQLAESGSFFGQVDLFKVRAKFALSDAYEDHHSLPKGKILVVTHRRVILLQYNSNIINQKKFNPARDPCSVLWDVLWDNLATMELTHGKKDQQSAPPSRLILYLNSRSAELKESVRVIKCYPDTNQAFKVYSSIEQAMNTYGPNQSKGMLRRKVKKPYSPIADVTNAEGTPKGLAMLSAQQMPATVALSSTFGSSNR